MRPTPRPAAAGSTSMPTYTTPGSGTGPRLASIARPVPRISPSSSATSLIHGTSSRSATPAARRARSAATVSASSGRARLWTRTIASRSESTAARIIGLPGGPGVSPEKERSGEDKSPHPLQGRIEFGPDEAGPDRARDTVGQLQHRPVAEDGPVTFQAEKDAVVVDDGRGASLDHLADHRHPGHVLPVQAEVYVLAGALQHGDGGEVVGGEALQVFPHAV